VKLKQQLKEQYNMSFDKALMDALHQTKSDALLDILGMVGGVQLVSEECILHRACMNGYTEKVQIMIDEGVNINLQYFGKTALNVN